MRIYYYFIKLLINGNDSELILIILLTHIGSGKVGQIRFETNLNALHLSIFLLVHFDFSISAPVPNNNLFLFR